MTHLLSDSKSAWLWQDGAFVPCDALCLWDRGFRYGMALFETLAVRQGRPLFVREHLRSLQSASLQCGFPLAADVFARIALCLDEPCAAPLQGLLRIYLTAGTGGPGAPVDQPSVYALWEPHPFEPKESCRLQFHGLPYQAPFGGLKTANYWANVQAFRQAQEAGWDEALLFAPDGALVSACMANVFVALDGVLHTPETGCGARAGILRRWVMERHEVRTSRLTAGQLQGASEIFLTNSRIGVLPASELAGRPLPSTAIGTMLRKDYESAIASPGERS